MARTTTDRGRFYTDAKDEKYWSVTTLINGGVPKPLLIPWAASQASHAMLDELVDPLTAMKGLLRDTYEWARGDQDPDSTIFDRLSAAIAGFDHTSVKAAERTVLQQITSGVPSVVDKGRSFISGAHKRTRDAAGEAGTEAHKLIEQYLLNKSEDGSWIVHSDNEIVMAVFENFLEFEKVCEPKWEASEMTVFNTTDKYAGTLDFIAQIPGIGPGLTMGDTKTGKGVYPEVALQLAAYRHADKIEFEHGLGSAPMIETNELAVVLHLRPEKWELIPVDAGEQQYDLFRHCAQIAWMTRDGNGDSFLKEIEFSGTRESDGGHDD